MNTRPIMVIGLLLTIIIVSGCCCCTGSQNIPTKTYTPTPYVDPIIGTWDENGGNLHYQFLENKSFYSYLKDGNGNIFGVNHGTWNSSGGNFYRITWDDGQLTVLHTLGDNALYNDDYLIDGGKQLEFFKRY